MKKSLKQFTAALALLLVISILAVSCSAPANGGDKTKITDGNIETQSPNNGDEVIKFEELTPDFDSSGAKADPAVQDAYKKLGDSVRQSGNKIITEIDEDDFVFSPLSFYLAFATLYNGANGEGAEELKQLLIDSSDLDQEMLNKACGLLIRELTSNEDFKVEVNTLLAGRIEYEFAADFLQAAADYYEAVGVKMDFSSPEALAALNEWTKEKTKGLIDPLFPLDYQFDDLTAMVLINTVYLLGKWEVPFDPNLTFDQTFNGLDGSSEVKMMNDHYMMDYAETDDYRMVSLEYKGGARMNLYLPADGVTPKDILLTGKEDTPEKTDVQLTLPRFEMESNIGLMDMLGKLTPSILVPESLQEVMTIGGQPVTDLFVSDSFQKTKVIVDEEGTEAAAAIVAEAPSASPDNPVIMIFDRPFAWEIVYDNVPLFSGVVSNLP
ncbi:MAG TPA: serpin family protein [Clostridiaceae bacterium]|nr:serpin family protein [Clostridiaceae bacterium]